MTTPSPISALLFTSLAPLSSPGEGLGVMELNVTSCEEWEKAHHLLFHLGNLSLLVGLVIPTTLALHMIVLRFLLMTGGSGSPPAGDARPCGVWTEWLWGEKVLLGGFMTKSNTCSFVSASWFLMAV